MELKNQACAKTHWTDLKDLFLAWTEWPLTVWSALALRSIRPSSKKVSTSVAPEWAWKHPTHVALGTDQTLISPDTEPEHIMDEDEKDRLRTDDLWPHRDWGEEQKATFMQNSKYSHTLLVVYLCTICNTQFIQEFLKKIYSKKKNWN